MKKVLTGIVCAAFLGGCAASSETLKIQLDSGRTWEVAKTRSGVAFLDCGTQLVSYLFDEKGSLVDSKSERGAALHCGVIEASIEAAGQVGAASVIGKAFVKAAKATRPDTVSVDNDASINNVNNQGQSQSQQQQQKQKQKQGQEVYWQGGSVEGGAQGNNGGGNGDGDGVNPGTGHHHGNGDGN